MNKVKSYTDQELMDKIKTLPEFTHIPKRHYFVFLRSKENAGDKFGHKVYLFKEETFIGVTSCTTTSGKYGLLNFKKWNRKGTAVLEFDRIYYNGWKRGLHKGKVIGWLQNKRVTVFRDNNKDDKAEEIGIKETGYFGINIHTITYKIWLNIVKLFIGRWSVGCLVFNRSRIFRRWWKVIPKKQTTIDVFLLKEF